MASNTRRREAFDIYWALGRERSLVGLHAELRRRGWRVSLRTVFTWSVRDAWQDRIVALEQEARAAADAERIGQLRAMYERQVGVALLLQQKGAAALQDLPTTDYKPDDALRALIEGARLERVARGEPTERIANEEGSSRDIFDQLSEPELRLLIDFADTQRARLLAEAPPGSGGVGVDGPADDQGAAAAPDAGAGDDLP